MNAQLLLVRVIHRQVPEHPSLGTLRDARLATSLSTPYFETHPADLPKHLLNPASLSQNIQVGHRLAACQVQQYQRGDHLAVQSSPGNAYAPAVPLWRSTDDFQAGCMHSRYVAPSYALLLPYWNQNSCFIISAPRWDRFAVARNILARYTAGSNEFFYSLAGESRSERSLIAITGVLPCCRLQLGTKFTSAHC